MEDENGDSHPGAFSRNVLWVFRSRKRRASVLSRGGFTHRRKGVAWVAHQSLEFFKEQFAMGKGQDQVNSAQRRYGHRLARIVCLVALGLAPLAAVAGGIPVMTGGDANLDACGSLGVVSGPSSGIPVRTGPSPRFASIEKLIPGRQVWLCDRKGAWTGVVYGKEGDDCGVATPAKTRRPYQGACASGWVQSKYIELVAG